MTIESFDAQTSERTFSQEYAEETLLRILKTTHTRAFLGIGDEDISKLRKVHYERSRGRYAQTPENEMYNRQIARLSKLSYREPYFILPDQTKTDIFYLLLSDGKERKAKKVEDAFYLLFEDFDSSLPDVANRLAQLNASESFPKNHLFQENEKTILGVEFIFGEYPKKGTDVSVFLDECRALNFGPDTNCTNFKVTPSGKLKYIDGDAVEWAQNPQNHLFDEARSATRKTTW